MFNTQINLNFTIIHTQVNLDQNENLRSFHSMGS